MPPQKWELTESPPSKSTNEGPPSSRGRHSSRGPPSSRASSRSVTPRNRDASPFATTNSNLGGNWERLETPNQTALMSPQVTARYERPPSSGSRRGSSQSARGPSPSPRAKSGERSGQWEQASLASSISSKAKRRADTPMPRRLDLIQKKSPYRWTGQHEGAPKGCKCPVCQPMDIAASRVAGLHSGTINLTLSDKLNLNEKPELGEVAPAKPELTAGSKRRGTEVGELIENQEGNNKKTATATGKGWGGSNSQLMPKARKTEVGDHLVLAGNEPRPEDADKFEFHLQFKGFKRKKKGYFSRPSHTGLSMQGDLWKERSHIKSGDRKCPAEQELGWDPEPRGMAKESHLSRSLHDFQASRTQRSARGHTPDSARSRGSSIGSYSSRGRLQRSLSERDLPLSETGSIRGERRRQPREYIVPQVNDKVIGAKFENVPQDHLYDDHRGPTNEHFHMSKPNHQIRPSMFQNGGGLIEQDPREQARRGIHESDLVCDSYHFEEGMPWMFSKSKGWGERDYIAKRRLRKWGEFSHGPSLRYVALEERAKPLYRYHRAVSAPPEVSGERHAASLLGSIPILGGDRGRCRDTWESWRPAKRGYCNEKTNSSREVADAVRNAEIHNYDKNFQKRVKSDPKFADLCHETAKMHRENKKMKKELRQKWQATSIGALLKPDPT
eukprot:gnl/MRDRNA2_/MRDRNA2_99742_c0_seq1.p1 gnl/MRDRNA2_/MRDRNA2_99742_c0~~gnl/MRDRNA2_/MRDRNA2_99742_c0_seq1.p1  ORF type:complete len:671 (+),score=91.70 gnl/MRDRNA2_/MRDRNA2_99742_c0_seq1:176-2188(+)